MEHLVYLVLTTLVVSGKLMSVSGAFIIFEQPTSEPIKNFMDISNDSDENKYISEGTNEYSFDIDNSQTNDDEDIVYPHFTDKIYRKKVKDVSLSRVDDLDAESLSNLKSIDFAPYLTEEKYNQIYSGMSDENGEISGANTRFDELDAESLSKWNYVDPIDDEDYQDYSSTSQETVKSLEETQVLL